MYSNVQNFPSVPLPAERLEVFSHTPLGELYRAIPFDTLAQAIPPPCRAVSGKGCQPWFDVRGGMALQVLKSYYKCSDAKLLELLNGNWQMQLFCGIQLACTEQIKDKGLVSRWRTYLGQYLNIDQLQISCVQHWKPFVEHPHSGFCDATVYESYITYPRDAKLLWRAIQDGYTLLQQTRKRLGLRPSRIHHQKRKQLYLGLAKRKKKSRRQNKKVCKRLLKYLERLLQHLDKLLQQHKATLSKRQQQRLTTIERLKDQQWQLYFGGQAKVPDRIVSLHKPYVRPIIRGKESKPVEFGCKVNLLQVGGLNFIEHVSYDNFNEGTRLQSTIALQRRYFGACYQMGADAIYATNPNRSYCTKNHIATSFVPKGKEGKLKEQKSQMRSILGKVRATVLEGSFGNEKTHYHLDQLKARTKANEMVWLFFGLLTSNAAQVAKRMQLAINHQQAA
jgi:transposase, IS5 family